jgi:hypothetical protein
MARRSPLAKHVAMKLYPSRGYQEIDRRPLVRHNTPRYTEGDAVLLTIKLESDVRTAEIASGHFGQADIDI